LFTEILLEFEEGKNKSSEVHSTFTATLSLSY